MIWLWKKEMCQDCVYMSTGQKTDICLWGGWCKAERINVRWSVFTNDILCYGELLLCAWILLCPYSIMYNPSLFVPQLGPPGTWHSPWWQPLTQATMCAIAKPQHLTKTSPQKTDHQDLVSLLMSFCFDHHQHKSYSSPEHLWRLYCTILSRPTLGYSINLVMSLLQQFEYTAISFPMIM